MKSIKEKSDEYLHQEKDEILCVYDRYAGFVDGANYVLEEIEFAMRLGSADHVSLAAVKECIINLKGDDK